MAKKPKSFRLEDTDISKLEKVHVYYKGEYETNVANSNMNDLYKWSEGQTVAMLIRDRYDELLKEGKVGKVE